MQEESPYREDSKAVQAHLTITQSVVQRMASNSASCKAYCVTLVSAILVVVADKNKPRYALLALVPTFLFFALDVYYLALEKMFRDSYNQFIDKLHSRKIVASDLYLVLPSGSMVKESLRSLTSFSIWPFYLVLLVMVVLAQKLVM
ncbi:MAG: hypothetical protein JXQ75_13775 [Phycisphaerae bacterium]|nr:hypothetical protein [Phycisphaerae bacterium]